MFGRLLQGLKEQFEGILIESPQDEEQKERLEVGL